MSIEALRLSLLRLLIQALELVRVYWYLAVPALLALAAMLFLRAKLWPAAQPMRHWRGLLVDVSEQHDLIVLIHAARQDAQFREEVLRLLRLPAATRRALLEDKLADMRARGEPASFIEAIGLLRDEHVVARTMRLLGEDS